MCCGMLLKNIFQGIPRLCSHPLLIISGVSRWVVVRIRVQRTLTDSATNSEGPCVGREFAHGLIGLGLYGPWLWDVEGTKGMVKGPRSKVKGLGRREVKG